MPLKRVKRVRRKTIRPKLNLKTRVLSIVNKQRENKCAILQSSDQLVQQGMTTQALLAKVMPEISQGTGQQNRIGNTITLTKLVIRGFYEVILPVTSYADQRIQLRQLINCQKGCKSARALLEGDADYNGNNLLEPSAPYTGTPAEYMTPINRDAFSPRRDRRWTLKTGIQSADPTNNQQVGSKTFVYYVHTLTFGKGKKLFYKTAGENDAENFPYFLSDSVNQMGLDDAPSTSVLRTMTCAAHYFDS